MAMSLKERIAAQKAAQNVGSAPAEQSIAPAPVAAPIAPAKDEVLTDALGKPLSGFALIKRRRELEAQAAANQAPKAEPPQATVESTKTVAPVATPIKEEAKVEEKKETVVAKIDYQGKVVVDVEEGEAEEATAETKQAYADIKVKIDELREKSELDLKTAMQDLKRSLMANPNACRLMLPSDIGQMVIALRKMTGIEIAKQNEGKKSGNAKKEKSMTAAELTNALDEL